MIAIRAVLSLALLLSLDRPTFAQESSAGLAAWDTGQALAPPLSPEVLALKAGWTAIPRGQTAASFRGDAVVTNGRILLVAGQRLAGVEVQTVVSGNAVSRARLSPLAAGSDRALQFDRAALVENARGAATLEATYKSSSGGEVSARFRLKRGDPAVEVSPGAGAEKLRLECPTRFALLPDFFADDVLVDARKIPVASTDLPSENFLLHLIAPMDPTSPGGPASGKGGDAIAMVISESREQEIRISLAGEREKRMITGSDIAFGGSKKVWLAFLEAPGIWHSLDLKREDAKKVRALEWKMPFVAQWRVDFSRPNDLVDGWDMLLQSKKGQDYVKPAWFGGPEERVDDNTRRRFTEVLGFFPYPCWSDAERRGYIEPLEVATRTKFVATLWYEGPMVLYPLNRVKETPPDAFTVVDVARNTLGMGPCEYILDVENQKQEYKGQATCPTRDALVAIYEKGEQKSKRNEIERRLKDAYDFVVHIRGRIARYVEFGRKIRETLISQKEAHPELKGAIEELEKIAQEMEARFAEREDRIKTPEYVAQMNEEFRKNVLDAEGPEALEKCKKYAEELVRIGGNQDKLVSECRWVARTLRQRAGLMIALDPRLETVAAGVRARAQEVLRNPSMHERARQ